MGSQEKYLRPDVIQQVKRLDLRAKFIVEGFLVGLQKSPFHGFSAEFSEHKKYEPGDDLARMDWSVYARTDRYYIKKFQAETNLTGYLAMDLSRSMDYPQGSDKADPEQFTKFEYSICLAAALAYLMVNQSDAVGLVTMAERIRTSLPPRSRRTQLGAILSALASASPDGQTDLPASLNELAGMIRHRSLVMVFSDLLPKEDGDGSFEDEIERTIAALYHVKHRGNDVILFHILDRTEVEFLFKGPTRFLGIETSFFLPAMDPRGVRAAYLEEVAALRETYRVKCLAANIDYVPLHTGMPFDKALLNFLTERRNRF